VGDVDLQLGVEGGDESGLGEVEDLLV
jgi:hypothetical protein